MKLSLGLYQAYSIAGAREWANGLNLQIDAGIDPRESARQELRLATMTVDRAHGLYMEAVREGRSSWAKRLNKPRTVADKQDIYRRDIAPKLGRKIIYDVTEADLIKLVEGKGKKARVRANRLAAELKVFFGWSASLRGLEVGLQVDPSRQLGDLRFRETPRSRRLALQEIAWFLQALIEEQRDYQRGNGPRVRAQRPRACAGGLARRTWPRQGPPGSFHNHGEAACSRYEEHAAPAVLAAVAVMATTRGSHDPLFIEIRKDDQRAGSGLRDPEPRVAGTLTKPNRRVGPSPVLAISIAGVSRKAPASGVARHVVHSRAFPRRDPQVRAQSRWSSSRYWSEVSGLAPSPIMRSTARLCASAEMSPQPSAMT